MTSRPLLGVYLVVVSVVWASSWGVFALLGDTGGSDLHGSVIVGTALSVGVLGVVLGVNVARRLKTGRRAWLGWSIVILAPVALLLLEAVHRRPHLVDRPRIPAARAASDELVLVGVSSGAFRPFADP
jgi:hypothetical protein